MNRPFLARIAARLLGKAPATPTAPHRPPAPRPGDSPDVWHVGDLAECIIEGGDWICRNTGHVLEDSGPQFRELYRVVDVEASNEWSGLTFTRWPGKRFSAIAFRKITPRADEAAAGTCATLRDLLRLPAPQPDEVV